MYITANITHFAGRVHSVYFPYSQLHLHMHILINCNHSVLILFCSPDEFEKLTNIHTVCKLNETFKYHEVKLFVSVQHHNGLSSGCNGKPKRAICCQAMTRKTDEKEEKLRKNYLLLFTV